MPYHHPTLPLRTDDDTSKVSNNDDKYYTGRSPRDLALMKKVASEKGFKSPFDHRESLYSITRAWCPYLQRTLDQCLRFAPSAQCDRTRQLFTSDCGATKVKEDKEYAEIDLEIKAKLRGMSTTEFLDYEKQEMDYCKDMCAKCKKVPIPRRMSTNTVEGLQGIVTDSSMVSRLSLI